MRKKTTAKKIGHQMARPKRSLSRRSLRKTLSSLMFVALVVSMVLGGRFFLLHFTGFKIKEVSIINHKGEPLPNPQAFFQLDNTLNLLTFDMERVVQDIQARHPEVAAISIRKQFPNKLLIVVSEREPLAIIDLREIYPVRKGRAGSNFSNGAYLVDAEGFILPFNAAYRALPRIVGIAPFRIQLYTKARSLRLKKALQLLKKLKKEGSPPKYIDMRFGNPVVKP